MKKILFILVATLLLLSCEKENFIVNSYNVTSKTLKVFEVDSSNIDSYYIFHNEVIEFKQFHESEPINFNDSILIEISGNSYVFIKKI